MGQDEKDEDNNGDDGYSQYRDPRVKWEFLPSSGTDLNDIFFNKEKLIASSSSFSSSSSSSSLKPILNQKHVNSEYTEAETSREERKETEGKKEKYKEEEKEEK